VSQFFDPACFEAKPSVLPEFQAWRPWKSPGLGRIQTPPPTHGRVHINLSYFIQHWRRSYSLESGHCSSSLSRVTLAKTSPPKSRPFSLGVRLHHPDQLFIDKIHLSYIPQIEAPTTFGPCFGGPQVVAICLTIASFMSFYTMNCYLKQSSCRIAQARDKAQATGYNTFQNIAEFGCHPHET
jgi:hypothetical protein